MDYKEKLEEARKLYASANADQKCVLESLFPELNESESEDEKTKKEIINYFECQSKEEPSRKDTHNKWIAWLENQEAKKPVKKQGNTNVFDAPKTSIKDAVEVSSRMQYIEDDMKPIADFIIDYALWDLRKDEWNQPTITVPLFRVLDALIQRGKPYCGCSQNAEKQSGQNSADNDKPEDKKIINGIIDFVTYPNVLLPDRKQEYITFLENLKENGRRINFSRKVKSEKQVVLITESNGNANIDWDTRSLEDARKLLEYGLQYINTELEKQGEKRTKDRYTFNSIPRLLDMIEPTDRAKSYCQKLIDSLLQEGYITDAKIVSNCLKRMNGEKVAMATMDGQKPVKVMKSPEESLGISSKEYNDIVNECLFGESKSVEKVEPKFHEGEWITNGLSYPMQISSIENGIYYTHNGTIGGDIESMDKEYHLWTIEDARDGDVLAVLAEDTCIFIIKKLNYDLGTKIYCCLHDDGNFEINSKLWFDYTSTYPATEEQRNALTKAMKEAGYVFDFDKKELKKLVDKEQIKKNLQDNSFRRMFEQKPAEWSEEDKDMMQALDACIDAAIKSGINYISFDSKSILIGNVKNWLKSLKQRIT